MEGGAKIFTGSPVRSVERAGRKWRLASERGSVTADWVIVATNAYSNGLWPELQSEFVRLPYYQCATTPLPNEIRSRILPNLEGTWDTRTVMRSLRRDAAGRLVVGSVGALRGGAQALHRSFSHRQLLKLFPFLKGIRFEHEWFGWIAMTANHLPRYHQLAEQVISFHGYNGRGIGAGTVFGKLLAERILRTDFVMPLPSTTPDVVKLQCAKAAFYEAGSAMAHLV
jgi:glycine/D-amino acid oxidase-like deaminating enzyme